eukprot:TRINITY_DN308_c0_g1_i2.p1 TRINITY_DN308_c0_g1~~TRINITY_DN308_c0_g1_i2.p1  ORF type:complete len:151 (-),score=6.58 TRINITY_DN308_c0_g1_i2:115-567(-)
MSYRDNDDDERQPLTSDDSVIQIGSDDSEDSQDANQDSFIFPSSSARAASSSSRLSLSSSSHIGDLPSKVGAKLHAPQSMFQNLDLFFTRVTFPSASHHRWRWPFRNSQIPTILHSLLFLSSLSLLRSTTTIRSKDTTTQSLPDSSTSCT